MQEYVAAVVPDPVALSLKMLSIISAVVDEGLWQLTGRSADESIDVDTHPDSKDKVLDVLSIGIRLLLSEGEGVPHPDGETTLQTWKEFRRLADAKLSDFAKGFLACKSWVALSEPRIEKPAGNAMPNCDAEVQSILGEGALVQTSKFSNLNSDQAMKFLTFCRKHPHNLCVRQHPCYREAESELLAWRLGNGSSAQPLELKTLVGTISRLVSDKLDPAWIVEASLLYKDGGHAIAFQSVADLRAFLHLRSSMMLALIQTAVSWLGLHMCLDLCVGDVSSHLAAADSRLTCQQDINDFRFGFCEFLLEFETRKENKVASDFAQELQDWILDMQELIGVTAQTDEFGSEVASGFQTPQARDSLAMTN